MKYYGRLGLRKWLILSTILSIVEMPRVLRAFSVCQLQTKPNYITKLQTTCNRLAFIDDKFQIDLNMITKSV